MIWLLALRLWIFIRFSLEIIIFLFLRFILLLLLLFSRLVSIFIIFTVSRYILHWSGFIAIEIKPCVPSPTQSNQNESIRIQSISMPHYRYCKLCIVWNNRASFLRKTILQKTTKRKKNNTLKVKKFWWLLVLFFREIERAKKNQPREK